MRSNASLNRVPKSGSDFSFALIMSSSVLFISAERPPSVSLTRPHGEEKANLISSFRMARRPSPEEFDKPFTPEELSDLKRRLSMLSPHHVADAYRQAHEARRMDGDRLPKASAVQELVTAWKLLWKWRRRRPVDRRKGLASSKAPASASRCLTDVVLISLKDRRWCVFLYFRQWGS